MSTKIYIFVEKWSESPKFDDKLQFINPASSSKLKQKIHKTWITNSKLHKLKTKMEIKIFKVYRERRYNLYIYGNCRLHIKNKGKVSLKYWEEISWDLQLLFKGLLDFLANAILR